MFSWAEDWGQNPGRWRLARDDPKHKSARPPFQFCTWFRDYDHFNTGFWFSLIWLSKPKIGTPQTALLRFLGLFFFLVFWARSSRPSVDRFLKQFGLRDLSFGKFQPVPNLSLDSEPYGERASEERLWPFAKDQQILSLCVVAKSWNRTAKWNLGDETTPFVGHCVGELNHSRVSEMVRFLDFAHIHSMVLFARLWICVQT